jgi:hypothetical protein
MGLKNNNNLKACDVEALIALCGGDEAEICQKCKKKKGKISVLTMCFNSCSFEILEAKKIRIISCFSSHLHLELKTKVKIKFRSRRIRAFKRPWP